MERSERLALARADITNTQCARRNNFHQRHGPMSRSNAGDFEWLRTQITGLKSTGACPRERDFKTARDLRPGPLRLGPAREQVPPHQRQRRKAEKIALTRLIDGLYGVFGRLPVLLLHTRAKCRQQGGRGRRIDITVPPDALVDRGAYWPRHGSYRTYKRSRPARESNRALVRCREQCQTRRGVDYLRKGARQEANSRSRGDTCGPTPAGIARAESLNAVRNNGPAKLPADGGDVRCTTSRA